MRHEEEMITSLPCSILCVREMVLGGGRSILENPEYLAS